MENFMKDFKTAIRMIKQELYILTAKQKRTSIFLSLLFTGISV